MSLAVTLIVERERIEVLAPRPLREGHVVQASVLALATVRGALVDVVLAARRVDAHEEDARIDGTILAIAAVAVVEALRGGVRWGERQHHACGTREEKCPQQPAAPRHVGLGV